MNPLNLLRERHNLHLPDEALQAIVNTFADIIVIQDQQNFEDETRRAIDEAGGCSRCGDLDGYSCTCNYDEDEYDEDEYF